MRSLCLSTALTLAVVWFAGQPSNAVDEAGDRLPEGDAGIAVRYPGDRGIDKDPAVVFVEDFEPASLDQVQKRWESVSGAEIMSLSGDRPPNSNGRRSLLMSHMGGQGSGGHLYRRLAPGYEKLHVRFYVKFDPDCAPIQDRKSVV